jgi:hypothetical protein
MESWVANDDADDAEDEDELADGGGGELKLRWCVGIGRTVVNEVDNDGSSATTPTLSSAGWRRIRGSGIIVMRDMLGFRSWWWWWFMVVGGKKSAIEINRQ